MHRILHTVSTQIQRLGRTLPNRPGDVFDYYNSKGASRSDIELDLATLEKKLKKIGVSVTDKPPHESILTINEGALSEEICLEIPTQSEQSRNHDIDCLTAIYRLRGGRSKKYLESCKAIFITTNTALAKASTRYFNRNHGVSDAAICMSDQVFTTLVWLKAVKKVPNLPQHRLVANCFAATQPSDELWSQYIKEADNLRNRGEIEESDYAVLIHSLEARSKLMELTLGDEDNVHGRVRDVLEQAKKKYTKELTSQVNELQNHLVAQHMRLEQVISTIRQTMQKIVTWPLMLGWMLLLVYAILRTSPEDLDKAHLLSVNAMAFWVFLLITLANLLFGMKLIGICKKISERISACVASWLTKTLIRKS